MLVINKILEGVPVREALTHSTLTVKEFVLLEMAGSTMFKLIDTTSPGWGTNPLDFVLYEGDKNAIVKTDYSDFYVVGYEPYNKHKMLLYIQPNK